jgi:potassium uptake TrkH family protein
VVASRAAGASRNPAQLVVGAFLGLILLGTVLLRLPFAVDPGTPHIGWANSLFTATSATTVTGLGTVDISVFSLFGELVLLVLIQVGGFGIMTIGSVLALVALRRVGLRQRMLAQAELGTIHIGELGHMILRIAQITMAVEAAVALLLFVAFARTDGTAIGAAAYQAVFTSVSAFNNAGISLFSDSLMGFVGNPLVVFPVTAAFILGGLGFPVLIDIGRSARHRVGVRPPRIRRTRGQRRAVRDWSLHTRLTLVTTGLLLLVGPLTVVAFEWTNARTLGELDVWDKVQAAWFQGVTPRTAGFNTVDIGGMEEPTLLVIIGLMFVGAGPASTSGGIKVTTITVLSLAMWSQVRGDSDVNVFDRRLPVAVIRQAMTVLLLSIGLVSISGIALTAMSPFDFTRTLFEATSAFGTVGLSTGITSLLPSAGQLLLVVMMIVGRVGPITMVTALVLRQRTRAYRFAEEQPIIG